MIPRFVIFKCSGMTARIAIARDKVTHVMERPDGKAGIFTVTDTDMESHGIVVDESFTYVVDAIWPQE